MSLQLKGQHHSDESHEQHAAHSHHIHKHHIAVFNGITSNFKHDETAYAIGFDYEYRFSSKIGFTALAEYISFDPGEIVAGAGVVFHPYKGLKFIAAPILLFTETSGEDIHSSSSGEAENETTFAFRVGVAYDFHLGSFSVGPVINWEQGKQKI